MPTLPSLAVEMGDGIRVTARFGVLPPRRIGRSYRGRWGFVWWAEGQDEAPPSFVDALSVDATEIVAVEDPDGPYVALMLTVTNSSDHPWTRVRLQVDFANSAGRVVDSWVDQNYDVYVPANGEIRFRILRSAIRPFSEYSSASVSVLSANRGGT
jgi:hypothetical protein